MFSSWPPLSIINKHDIVQIVKLETPCSFLCLDAKKRTKRKIKALEKTPEPEFAYLVAENSS
jgi:hypothetical protein